MIIAKNKDVTRIMYRRKYYAIYDAFPGREGAEQVVADMRKAPYPISVKDYTCRAIVVDLGPDAGRLRYGVFIAKGSPI